MLSSNSSCNQEPFPNYTHTFPENDITFSLFPSSPDMLFDYQDFYLQFLDLFYHHQQTTPMAADSGENAVINEDGPSGKPAVRSSKKDRHSKINTARGPRDRRMRLSLDIARKFFDLQDLLGYDKASRTVEWLLRNSGPAIKELARARNISHCSEQSSTCEEECEGVSSVVPSAAKNRMKREKVKRVVGRGTVARESRRKARERARERTSQKRRLINQSSEEGKVYGQVTNLVYDKQQQQQQQQEEVEPWNPSTVFNYQEENSVFFNNQDEQIEEFEFSGKPWDAFNSFTLSG